MSASRVSGLALREYERPPRDERDSASGEANSETREAKSHSARCALAMPCCGQASSLIRRMRITTRAGRIVAVEMRCRDHSTAIRSMNLAGRVNELTSTDLPVKIPRSFPGSFSFTPCSFSERFHSRTYFTRPSCSRASTCTSLSLSAFNVREKTRAIGGDA